MSGMKFLLGMTPKFRSMMTTKGLGSQNQSATKMTMMMMTMSMIQISRSVMKPISVSMMTGKVLMTMTAANVKSATKMMMMKTKMSMTPISRSMMTAKALTTSQHQKCHQNGDDKQDDNDQNQLDDDQTGDDRTQDDNHT